MLISYYRQTDRQTDCEYREHEKKCRVFELFRGKFRLELLTDIDIMVMFEKGIRVRVTEAAKLYTKAYIKYQGQHKLYEIPIQF